MSWCCDGHQDRRGDWISVCWFICKKEKVLVVFHAFWSFFVCLYECLKVCKMCICVCVCVYQGCECVCVCVREAARLSSPGFSRRMVPRFAGRPQRIFRGLPSAPLAPPSLCHPYTSVALPPPPIHTSPSWPGVLFHQFWTNFSRPSSPEEPQNNKCSDRSMEV